MRRFIIIGWLCLFLTTSGTQAAESLPVPLHLRQPGFNFYAVQWSADGTRLLTSTTDARCTIVYMPPAGVEPRAFCDQPVAVDDYRVRVWDVDPQSPQVGAVLHEFAFDNAAQARAAWNADESAIVIWNERAGAYIHNALDGDLLHRVEPQAGFAHTAWNPDGEHLLTLRRESPPADATRPLLAEVWRNGERLEALSLPGFWQHFQLRWSADGTTLIYVTDGDGPEAKTVMAYRWQMHNAGSMTVTRLGQRPNVTPYSYNMSISADLTRLWFSDEFTGEIQAWDVERSRLVEALRYSQVSGLWLNADESRLLTWSRFVAVVLDSRTLTHKARWDYDGDPTLNIFQAYWINATDEAVIAADVALRWLPDADQLEPVPCQATRCGFPAWSADERYLVFADYNRLGVHVLDGRTMTPLLDFSLQVPPSFAEDVPINLRWSPDGQRLAAVQGDSIFIWTLDG
jgi:hypothetical protein